MSKIVPRGAGAERLLLEAAIAHHLHEVVTKPPANVTKVGRPAKFGKAMTATERKRLQRAKVA